MAQVQIKEQNSFLSQYKGFIAGSIGGIAQVLTGQPMDILKVRLQASNNPNITMTQVAKNLIKTDGMFGFYKGTTAPLVTISAYVSVQFGIFESAKSYIQKLSGKEELSLYQLTICSALAGYGSSFISAPVEHIRIRQQISSKGTYKSTMHCINTIYKNNGLKGLYKGFIPTQMRDVVGNIFYFLPYNYALKALKNPEKGDAYLTGCQLLSGGIAGICAWTAAIPIDVIKSKIQADNMKNPQYKGIIQCTKQTYNELGFKGFFKGIVPCFIRAVIVNASTFGVYEQAMKSIKKYE